MTPNKGTLRHKGKLGKNHFLTLAFVMGLCGTGSTVLADKAIVIGVNEYVNMPDQSLDGCVNDAALIENALRRRKFDVETCTNEKAVKSKILAALAKVKRSIQPGERFVFFFAGHGAQNGYILPQDAKWNGENCLAREELRQLVAAIPARSHTVILDACFSETMIQKGVGLDEKVRGVVLKNIPAETSRATEAGLDEEKPRGEGDADKSPAKTDICYWTSAAREQPAIEKVLPTPLMIAELKAKNQPVPVKGEKHGVFSYFAAQELSKDSPHWSELNARVRQRIQSVLLAKQWPMVSKDFTHTPVFETNAMPVGVVVPALVGGNGDASPLNGAKPTKPVAALPPSEQPAAPASGDGSPAPPVKVGPGNPAPLLRTLWEEFAQDRSDATMLRLEVKPDKAVVHKEATFQFGIHVGMEGYLVIISQNEKGRLHLVYPAKGFKVEDAHVNANQQKDYPNANFTEEGSFHVRALLLASPERAGKLLAAFGNKRDIENARQAGEKDLELGEEATELPYTADLMFQVLPAQAANPAAAAKEVSQ